MTNDAKRTKTSKKGWSARHATTVDSGGTWAQKAKGENERRKVDARARAKEGGGTQSVQCSAVICRGRPCEFGAPGGE